MTKQKCVYLPKLTNDIKSVQIIWKFEKFEKC